jgi:tetratricopeptide (TPR) repeat protein
MTDRTLLMSETLFDKPQIIALMRLAFARLRHKRVFVADILESLHATGFEVSRGRFDDWFMTRPERDVIAPIHVFVAVVNICFTADTAVWSAHEFVRLLIAMRIPINQIDQFSRYFRDSDWYDALQKHHVLPIQRINVHQLIGRETVLEQLKQALVSARYLLLYGPAGIGKTALMLELRQQYEHQLQQKTIFINMTSIETLAQLIDHIAHVCEVRPLGNEPILLRLQFVLNHTRTYLFIDGVDSESGLACATILNYLRQHFPFLYVIFSIRNIETFTERPDTQIIEVPPLTYDSPQAPGYQLFVRVYRQAGGVSMERDAIIHACAATNGVPLYIGMVANLAAQTLTSDVQLNVVEQVLQGVSSEELDLLMFLGIIRTPVTLRFLQVFGSYMVGITEQRMQQMVTDLIQRQLIYQFVREQDEVIAIHALVLHVIEHITSADHYNRLLTLLAEELLRIDDTWENGNQQVMYKVKALDLPGVLAVIDLIQKRQSPEFATQLLVQWHTVWYRHGFAIEVIEKLEQSLALIPESNPLSALINFVLGSLYGSRGLFRLSLQHLQTARALCRQHDLHTLYHRVTVEWGWRSMSEISKNNSLFVEISYSMQQSIAYFMMHGMPHFAAHAYNHLSNIYFSIGKLEDAMSANDESMRLFRTGGFSLGMLDTVYNRGLVFLGIGDFAGARKVWAQAEREYANIGFSLNKVNCALRTAGVAILQNDVSTAQQILMDSFDIVSRSGGLHDAFYMIDIYSGVLLLIGRPCDCYMVSTVMMRIRQERGIFLGAFPDGIVAELRQRAFALCEQQAGSSRFQDEMTFYDIVREIRSDIHAWRA